MSERIWYCDRVACLLRFHILLTGPGFGAYKELSLKECYNMPESHAALYLIVNEMNRLHRLKMLMYAWKLAWRIIAEEKVAVNYLCEKISDIVTEAEPLPEGREPKHRQIRLVLMWYTPQVLFDYRQVLTAASMVGRNPDRFSAVMRELYTRKTL